jgi:hypothetical protein
VVWLEYVEGLCGVEDNMLRNCFGITRGATGDFVVAGIDWQVQATRAKGNYQKYLSFET